MFSAENLKQTMLSDTLQKDSIWDRLTWTSFHLEMINKSMTFCIVGKTSFKRLVRICIPLRLEISTRLKLWDLVWSAWEDGQLPRRWNLTMQSLLNRYYQTFKPVNLLFMRKWSNLKSTKLQIWKKFYRCRDF